SNLDQAARALVDAANEGGGEDNITIVLFEIGEGGAALEDPATLPVAAGAEPAADEETLSGLEGVPTIDETTVMNRAELEALARRDGRDHGQHRRVRRTAVI